MSSLHFNGGCSWRVFIWAVPSHELTPMQVDGVAKVGAFRAVAEALTGTLLPNRLED